MRWGWCVTLLWGFSDYDPTSFNLNLNNPHPNNFPTPATLFFLTLRGAITLYFHCRLFGGPRWEPSSPPSWHSSLQSHLLCYHPSQSYHYGDTHTQENQRKTRTEEILLTANHQVSFSQLNCLLGATFCVNFQRKEEKKWGENMQDGLREFVFPPGTECISRIMWSSSLS